jgi:hypothetical protein
MESAALDGVGPRSDKHGSYSCTPRPIKLGALSLRIYILCICISPVHRNPLKIWCRSRISWRARKLREEKIKRRACVSRKEFIVIWFIGAVFLCVLFVFARATFQFRTTFNNFWQSFDCARSTGNACLAAYLNYLVMRAKSFMNPCANFLIAIRYDHPKRPFY